MAKVATEKAKPDGVCVVEESAAAAFLAPLSVRSLPGIGPRAAEELKTLGIETLGQLAAMPDGPLRRALGPRHAASLKRRAAGMDDAPIEPRSEAKSISAETTFDHDLSDGKRLEEVLTRLAERVGSRLRKAGLHARNVHLKLRYSDFSTITRQRTLGTPVDGDAAIVDAAVALLRAALRERSDPVRLIGAGVGGLGEPEAQLSLLDGAASDDSAVSSAIDAIRRRFGEDAIRRGSRGKGRSE
jgi:DNA polymerase-4